MNNNRKSEYLTLFNLGNNLPTTHYPINGKSEDLYFKCGSADGFVAATNYFYEITQREKLMSNKIAYTLQFSIDIPLINYKEF